MCRNSNTPSVSALDLTPMHWFLQEDDEGVMKFEGDGKLVEDQAVRFTANSIMVADIEAKSDKVKGWCVRNTPFQGQVPKCIEYQCCCCRLLR